MPVNIIGPVLLLIAIVIAAVVIIRKANAHFATLRPDIDDSEGQEVFRGSGKEAAQAVHTLADAGIVAWIETDSAGQVGVFVDSNQHQDIPALLAVQKHLQANPAAAAGVS